MDRQRDADRYGRQTWTERHGQTERRGQIWTERHGQTERRGQIWTTDMDRDMDRQRDADRYGRQTWTDRETRTDMDRHGRGQIWTDMGRETWTDRETRTDMDDRHGQRDMDRQRSMDSEWPLFMAACTLCS